MTMEIKTIKRISEFFSSMCYSAAFAFVASLVFEISSGGTFLAFVLILITNVTVEFFSRKQQRLR